MDTDHRALWTDKWLSKTHRVSNHLLRQPLMLNNNLGCSSLPGEPEMSCQPSCFSPLALTSDSSSPSSCGKNCANIDITGPRRNRTVCCQETREARMRSVTDESSDVPSAGDDGILRQRELAGRSSVLGIRTEQKHPDHGSRPPKRSDTETGSARRKHFGRRDVLAALWSRRPSAGCFGTSLAHSARAPWCQKK